MAERGPSRWDAERAVVSSDLPSPSRLLLLVLLTHVTNGTLVVPQRYSPSLTTLAKETGLSRRAVADHLGLLESKGWLKRARPTAREARVEQATTGYTIAIPAALIASAGDALVQEMHYPPTEAGYTEDLFTASAGDALVQGVHGGSAGAAPNPMYSPSSSPTEKKKGGAGGRKQRPKTADEHPSFGPWYAAYPVHKARGAAVKAYAAALKKADAQTLLAAAKLYAATKAATDPKYIKHPATWLNQECWLDEAAPANGFAATGTDGVRGYGSRARVNDIDWSQGGPKV